MNRAVDYYFRLAFCLGVLVKFIGVSEVILRRQITVLPNILRSVEGKFLWEL
jgi:hypothetical protein